ncbi:hypothetical protein JHD49_04830 [Sulfurimonas sp. SAG-AH-194-C21]|nr:hypothetical protein [Sulfurimonas sp. SAG-AH-194-C21]MDF1883258.1 hypothetical protein [Sulfurimonas sp. SAG-AH-194-C21]
MLEREFTIDANNLDLTIYESLDDSYAQSLCENELEIPEECIRKIECYENVFKIYLAPSRKYFRDDWYVNLQRLKFVS